MANKPNQITLFLPGAFIVLCLVMALGAAGAGYSENYALWIAFFILAINVVVLAWKLYKEQQR